MVPGDIVRVRAGDFVPADLKMIEKSEVSADQSALTGESMTVEKNQGDLLYSGINDQARREDWGSCCNRVKDFLWKNGRTPPVGKTKVTHGGNNLQGYQVVVRHGWNLDCTSSGRVICE